mmetsp:Transcript_81357/g.209433  ORF Transcript_81357/g.209433 Transcript_81357/m.209433 type:complete len:389 (-) Transcript_81357:459-1625(-)
MSEVHGRLVPESCLTLLRRHALHLELLLRMLRGGELLRAHSRLALEFLNLLPQLRNVLTLLTLEAQSLHLRLTPGLVDERAQRAQLLLKFGFSRSPRLSLLPQALSLLGASSTQPRELLALHLSLSLEALQLAFHRGQLGPLMLALRPEGLPLLIEVCTLTPQLLLPGLQHLGPLLRRSQLDAHIGDLLLCHPLRLESLLQVALDFANPRLVLLVLSLLVRAVEGGHLLFHRLPEAVEVLHRLHAHLLELLAHGLRHLVTHLVNFLELLVTHLLQGLLRRLLCDEPLVELIHLLVELVPHLLLLLSRVADLLLQDADALGVSLPHLQQRALVLAHTVHTRHVLDSHHLLREHQRLHRLVRAVKLGADVGNEQGASVASQAVSQQHGEH